MGNSEGYAFPGRYPEHFAIGVLRGGERDETCLRSPYPQGVPRSRPGTDAALPPCPVSSQANCRSENRIWLADMFAHKARRNRNFQRTEKGPQKAALMGPISFPPRACWCQKKLSESSTAEPRRLPARCRRNSLAPFFVEERRTWTAEHRSDFRPGTGRAEAGSVRQSFLLQNAL